MYTMIAFRFYVSSLFLTSFVGGSSFCKRLMIRTRPVVYGIEAMIASMFKLGDSVALL